MTLWHVKPPWHFCLFDNAGMWGAYKEKEGREKGRTRAGAVEREGRSGTEGKFRRLSEEQGGVFHKVEYWQPNNVGVREVITGRSNTGPGARRQCFVCRRY